MSGVRVLPADVYDALELSALAHGGIGQPMVFDYSTPRDEHGQRAPCCIHGHAYQVSGEDDIASDDILNALGSAGIRGSYESDDAVRAVNERRGRSEKARISFRQWCAELGVVRGE